MRPTHVATGREDALGRPTPARPSIDGQPLAVAIGPDGTWWVLTEESRVLYRGPVEAGGFEEVARA